MNNKDKEDRVEMIVAMVDGKYPLIKKDAWKLINAGYPVENIVKILRNKYK